MINRFLEKKVEIEVQEIRGKSGNTLELEYYLVESEPAEDNPAKREKEYGVQIIMKQGGAQVDSITCSDVFPGRDETKRLVRLLAENSVTPVSLPYILDDLL